jgi:hypothetical protein
MRNQIIFLSLLLLFPIAECFAQETSVNLKNMRVAKGNTLVSDSLPKVKLKFSKDFKYAGGQTFILYGIARAEQHFYVDADKDGRISRFYWVQFEGYLPENTHKYNYSGSQKIVTIDGLEFFADAWRRKHDPATIRPGGDRGNAVELLKSKGYTFKSDEFIMQRLVHLTDTSNRNELMVIYQEFLPAGTTAADLEPGGKDAAKWPQVSEDLLARARQNMKIEK